MDQWGRTRWTQQEDMELRRSYGRIPVAVVADKLNRTEGAVKQRARSIGAAATRGRPWTYDEDLQLHKLREGEFPLEKIASLLDRGRRDIEWRIKVQDLGLVANGFTTRQLAFIFGVAERTVLDWQEAGLKGTKTTQGVVFSKPDIKAFIVSHPHIIHALKLPSGSPLVEIMLAK